MRFGVMWRALVWLKRLTLASERMAISMETLAKVESSKWEHEHAPVKPKQTIYGTFDREEAEREYARRMADGEVIVEEDE